MAKTTSWRNMIMTHKIGNKEEVIHYQTDTKNIVDFKEGVSTEINSVKNVPNGLATLGPNGKVLDSQLPVIDISGDLNALSASIQNKITKATNELVKNISESDGIVTITKANGNVNTFNTIENAKLAYKLKNPVTINGVQFDGSRNIQIDTGVRTMNSASPDDNGDVSLFNALRQSLPVNFNVDAKSADELSRLGVFDSRSTSASAFPSQPTDKGQLLNLPLSNNKSDYSSYQLWMDGIHGDLYGRQKTPNEEVPFLRFLTNLDQTSLGIIDGNIDDPEKGWWIQLGGKFPIIIQGMIVRPQNNKSRITTYYPKPFKKTLLWASRNPFGYINYHNGYSDWRPRPWQFLLESANLESCDVDISGKMWIPCYILVIGI